MATTAQARTPARRPSRRRVPLSELEERNLQYRRERGAVSETLDLDARIFRTLKEVFHVKWCHELEDPDIIPRLEAASGTSPNTVRVALSVFRSILRRGLTWDLLRAEPRFPDYVKTTGRRLPRSPRNKAPSRRGVDRLFEHLGRDESWEGRRLHALVAIVALAGFGLRQALRLRVADIDLARGIIRLSGGRSMRHRPDSPIVAFKIGDGLRTILAAWLPLTGCEWAFPGKERLGPWNCHGLVSPGRCLAAACRAGGLKPITFESLRRYFAENAFPTTPGAPLTRPEPATSTRRASHTIRLAKPGQPTFIDGQRMEPVTDSQYVILSALLKAGDEGLTPKQIVDITGQGGWRQTLWRLKLAHPLWDAIIVFPGGRGRPYRLDARPAA